MLFDYYVNNKLADYSTSEIQTIKTSPSYFSVIKCVFIKRLEPKYDEIQKLLRVYSFFKKECIKLPAEIFHFYSDYYNCGLAQFILGFIYEYRGDLSKSVCFFKLAQKHYPQAATKLELMQDPQKINFSEEELEDGWKTLATCKQQSSSSEEFLKKQRFEKRFINFSNVCGSPETRVQLGGKIFIEANWITRSFVAAGHPNDRTRATYWYMIATLLHNNGDVVIVSLVNKTELKSLGGKFYPDKIREAHHINGFLSSEGGDDYLFNSSLRCLNVDRQGQWTKYSLQLDGKSLLLFEFDQWTDMMDTDTDQLYIMIKQLDMFLQHLNHPILVVNCRASVGRTGTFLTAYHFYNRMRKEAVNLIFSPLNFSMQSVVQTIKNFRRNRGSDLFVQTKSQFNMVCRIIEKIDQDIPLKISKDFLSTIANFSRKMDGEYYILSISSFV